MQVRYQAALRPDVRMGILHNPNFFGKPCSLPFKRYFFDRVTGAVKKSEGS